MTKNRTAFLQEARPEQNCQSLFQNADAANSNDSFTFDELEEQQQFWNEIDNTTKTDQIKDSGRKTGKNGNDGRMTGKLVKKCNVNAVIRDIAEPCCKRGCIFTTSPQTVLNKRTSYWGKSENERAAFVYQAIEAGRVEDKGNLLMVDGVLVCSTAWCRIHGIVLSSFYKKLAEIRRGDKKGEAPRQRKKSLGYNLAEEWFCNFARNADYMPTSLTEHFLPAYPNWQFTSCTQKRWQDRKCSPGHISFTICGRCNTLMSSYQRFTKCAICVHLRERLRSPGLDEETRRESALMRKVHLTQQMTEREKYYKHGVKSKSNPDKYLSITIDGMDQSKHNLPHFNISTKIDGSAWRLRTHVTGVLTNYRSSAYAFIDLCEWPHDSNLTINVILQTLLLVKNSIKLCYLMVGHTHEDIDQMFLCVARRLLKKDALTLEQLKEEITESYTLHVEVHSLDAMFDVKAWMEEAHDGLSGHINQHQFKIEKNEEGHVVVYYKKWSTSPTWLPEDGIIMTDGIPRGEPGLDPPNLAKINLDKIIADLPKFRLKFNHSTNQWWSDFIQNQQTRHDGAECSLRVFHYAQPYYFFYKFLSVLGIYERKKN
ncbi:hypothetical protein OS493_024276 [Desmophyllum pertusum]|uniref:DUF7869 domain-containing protein n=1 Tax=Desmophyllum pertusum TaxID=174260 RepID=A0A9W9YY79_9CNID|nr:hypothetical protein OS493_024276 [Desmophyllum pertusum]